jgi:tetratricopeptide (TPR) repeat protein
MDSKHRHELEQNDLVIFLTHFNEWWKKYGQMTLLVILVIVGAFTFTRYYQYNKMQAHESAWGALAQSTSPESYRATAAENKGAVQALAYLRGADLLLAQATLPQTKTEQPVQDVNIKPADDATKTDENKADAKPENAVTVATPQQQDPKVMLEDARAMYQAVVDDKMVHPVLRINGMLGLASVAESQGDWDTASASYDKAIELAGTRYAVLAQQAAGRKAKLDDIKSPVQFVKATPAPAPKAMPAVEDVKAPSAKLDLSSPVLPEMKKDATDQTSEPAAPAAGQ